MEIEHRENCLKFSRLLMKLVLLLVKSSVSPVFSLKPGETLRLDLNTSDPVELSFKRNEAEIHIFTVGRGKVLSDPRNETRVSISNNTLVLNGVISSDSGVYTVREHHTGKISSVYNITVSVHHSSLQLKTDESVRLDFFTSVPVEVILSRTHAADSEDVVICTVENHKPDCLHQYKTRVSVSNNTLVLNGMMPSDSGVYTVRERRTNETISVYNVTVSVNDGGEVRQAMMLVLVLVPVLLSVLVIVVFVLPSISIVVVHNLRRGREGRPCDQTENDNQSFEGMLHKSTKKEKSIFANDMKAKH